MHLSLVNPAATKTLQMLRPAGLACVITIGAGLLLAQSASPPKASTHKKPAAGQRHHAAKKDHRGKPAQAIAATPAPPSVPPKPNWPADQPAQPATITWDSHGLEVKASNSSLQQILSEIQTVTGAKVDGLENDVRIFGNYGPGPSREVLYQLLHGTGYNVLILGNEGQGKPLTVILTSRTTAVPETQAQNPPQPPQNDDVDNQQEPQPGTPISPMAMPGNQPQFISPQQKWQEMQRERQQQIEQQQGPPPQ